LNVTINHVCVKSHPNRTRLNHINARIVYRLKFTEWHVSASYFTAKPIPWVWMVYRNGLSELQTQLLQDLLHVSLNLCPSLHHISSDCSNTSISNLPVYFHHSCLSRLMKKGLVRSFLYSYFPVLNIHSLSST